MKKGLFFLIIVAFSHCHNRRFKAISQKLEPPDCGWFGNMKVEERRKTFPFNEATKVLLISFSDFRSENEPKFKPKAINITETTTPWGEPLPLVNVIRRRTVVDTFNVFNRAYRAYEVVRLNQEQIDVLSNLVFNYKLKTLHVGTRAIKGCYNPRNCILFFDKDNVPILNFEICIECENMYFYPSFQGAFFDNTGCHKTGLYKAFFKQNNVHFGVDSLKN